MAQRFHLTVQLECNCQSTRWLDDGTLEIRLVLVWCCLQWMSFRTREFLCCWFVQKCYISCILKVNSATFTYAHWAIKQNKEKGEFLRNWRTQEMGVLFSWRCITSLQKRHLCFLCCTAHPSNGLSTKGNHFLVKTEKHDLEILLQTHLTRWLLLYRCIKRKSYRQQHDCLYRCICLLLWKGIIISICA